MEFSVYVLKSETTGKRYIGMTSKDPKDRLEDHNIKKSNKSTKNVGPYTLIYFESGYCKTCALKRELFLKSGKGRFFLDNLLN